MPELPDIEAYRHALRQRLLGQPLTAVSIRGPSLLRTFDPPVERLLGQHVDAIERIGKRLAFVFDSGACAVLHLMIAGRLQWKDSGAPPRGKIVQASFSFSNGVLVLTEAGTQERATLHVLSDRTKLAQHDPGGAELDALTPAAFQELLQRENRTLKRALANPRAFAGIGNAFSDEILHAAQLSPVRRTQQLSETECTRLFAACREVLNTWRDRLCQRFDKKFPGTGQITAFRPEFAVHGKYGQPCPTCNSPVQRIRYASNETNYCATCQTGGKLLADRSLSRLLKEDWPRTIEEWETE